MTTNTTPTPTAPDLARELARELREELGEFAFGLKYLRGECGRLSEQNAMLWQRLAEQFVIRGANADLFTMANASVAEHVGEEAK